eukprot:scaffold4929_cov176-Amphora_coffeaeformis.AAC.11
MANNSIHQTTVDLMQSFEKANTDNSFSPKELFRLGRVLHQLDVLQAEQVKHDVQTAYHQLLLDLPQRRRYFDGLHQGLHRMLQQQQQVPPDGITEAMEAMDSLYRFSTLAEASRQCTIQTLHALSGYYANLNSASSREVLLSFLFRLLWKTPSQISLEWQDLLPILEDLQEKNVWKPLARHLDEIATGWQEAWLDGCADEAQRDYLTSWLQTAASNPDDDEAQVLADAIARAQPSPRGLRPKKTAAPVATADPLKRQIDQVRAILPQYGEGLVELALSLRQGQVEDTVALLSSSTDEWPVALRTVDPALPRRHQKRVVQQDALAKERTKEAIRASDEQQETEALVLAQIDGAADEYNDDYDDQWDTVDTAGANDGGLYDDYQAVRTYNRVVRDAEREAAFWQASANTNRSANANNKPKVAGGFRGPDKLKGGRIPKPAESGGGGSSQNNNNRKKKNENPKPGNAKFEGIDRTAGKGKASGKGAAVDASGGDKPPNNDGKPSKAAQRQKERKMANRKDKQRQAMEKRAG